MDIALADGMFVRAAGPNNGRTLLFIHALADCGLAFTPLFDTLLAHSFRLIVVDLPGFGASPPRHDVQTIEQHASAVATLVNAMAATNPIGLVGHSIGSMIAVRAAARLGQRFAGLFSIEGNLTAEDAYFSGKAADFDNPHAFKDRLLEELWAMAQTQPILRRFHGTMTQADAVTMWTLGRDARRLSVGDAPGQAYLRVRPSLYYWSPLTTADSTQGWIARSGIANLQFVNAGHWPTIEQPAATARAIQSFFTQS
jgi:pimeloyl-ACP methyl ester carboxylesterase